MQEANLILWASVVCPSCDHVLNSDYAISFCHDEKLSHVYLYMGKFSLRQNHVTYFLKRGLHVET